MGKVYGKEEAWTFEPHVAEKLFHELIAEANAGGQTIRVLLNHRIVEAEVKDSRLKRIMLEKVAAGPRNEPGHPDHIEEHIPIEAAMFIDCGYDRQPSIARASSHKSPGRRICAWLRQLGRATHANGIVVL